MSDRRSARQWSALVLGSTLALVVSSLIWHPEHGAPAGERIGTGSDLDTAQVIGSRPARGCAICLAQLRLAHSHLPADVGAASPQAVSPAIPSPPVAPTIGAHSSPGNRGPPSS